jgi:hypothetical protein
MIEITWMHDESALFDQFAPVVHELTQTTNLFCNNREATSLRMLDILDLLRDGITFTFVCNDHGQSEQPDGIMWNRS